MSQELNENNYSDYFKALEKRIDNDRAQNNPKNHAVTEKYKHSVTTKKHSKRLYHVIKIRAPFLVVTLLVVLGVIFGTSKVVGLIKSKGNDVNESTSSSDAYQKDEAVTPKVTFNTTENTIAIPDTNDAKHALIIDTKTNNIVASRDENTRAFPASTTKIMTLLVAVQNISDYNETFTMSTAITDPLYQQDASVAGFLDGEVISMTDLLYGTILPSGADAAVGLAIKIAGSEERFVNLMNQEVKALGLKDTHFTNVTGLFNENHYTTAHDMAVILYTAMQNETCKKILSQDQPYTTAKTPQHPQGIPLQSTLFTYMYGTEPETATIQGGKTGYVNEAGYCIASFGENNTTKNEYLVVTLGNSSKWPAFYGQIDLYKQFAQ